MQDDMRANFTEARGMLYLPFQFGESAACPIRESAGIRILHDEDPATAFRTNYFRKVIEDARAAKVRTSKVRATKVRAPKKRASSRKPKKRAFLSTEQTMEPASKYSCTAFQVQEQWKRSPYSRGDQVLYGGDVVTLKGFDHASRTYSVQCPGTSGLFEVPPPAKKKHRANVLGETTEERLDGRRQRHAGRRF